MVRSQAYLNRTPILFPLPPTLYRPMPTILKRTLFLDLPFYQFDENEDGREAIENEVKRLRDEGEEI